MFRFGIVLSVVLIAIGLLAAGVVAGSLLLVDVSIGVASLATLLLVTFVVIWRREIFGTLAATRERVGVAPAGFGRVGARTLAMGADAPAIETVGEPVGAGAPLRAPEQRADAVVAAGSTRGRTSRHGSGLAGSGSPGGTGPGQGGGGHRAPGRSRSIGPERPISEPSGAGVAKSTGAEGADGGTSAEPTAAELAAATAAVGSAEASSKAANSADAQATRAQPDKETEGAALPSRTARSDQGSGAPIADAGKSKPEAASSKAAESVGSDVADQQ